MPELEERQLELGGVVFGDLTPLQVDDVNLGDAEVRLGDRPSPLGDGQQFGLDYRDGRTISVEVWTDTTTATDARTALSALRKVWSADVARATSRAVVPLRLRMPGSDTVRVYGRPRRMTPATQRMRDAGLIDVVADFQTADRFFYADVAHEITLTLVTTGGGGITWPVEWPITWAPGGARQDSVVNRGEAPTWPVFTIHGPVAQPSIELVGSGRRLRLDTTLAFDRTITIDTRPWARTILRDDGASFAGVARGAALADFRVPVGQTFFAYRGTDLSGQSSCTITWRDATETP